MSRYTLTSTKVLSPAGSVIIEIPDQEGSSREWGLEFFTIEGVRTGTFILNGEINRQDVSDFFREFVSPYVPADQWMSVAGLHIGVNFRLFCLREDGYHPIADGMYKRYPDLHKRPLPVSAH